MYINKLQEPGIFYHKNYHKFLKRPMPIGNISFSFYRKLICSPILTFNIHNVHTLCTVLHCLYYNTTSIVCPSGQANWKSATGSL